MKTENETIEVEVIDADFKAPILKDIKYPISQAYIDDLLKEYAEVPEIDPESEEAGEQYQYVLNGHKLFMKARTSIEKVRKTLKAPALDYGKKVDDIAKEFQAKINPTEKLLATARHNVENHEKRKIEEAEEAERQRVQTIEDAITGMRNLPLGVMGAKSDTIKDIIEKLALPDVEQFDEFLDRAIDTYKLSMEQLHNAYETTLKSEQADKIMAEQKAKADAEEAERQAALAKEREEFNRQQSELKRQQDELAAQTRAQQEEINRQQAEIEAEKLAAQQELERIEREKRDRAEQIKRDAEIKMRKAAEDKINMKLFKKQFNEARKAIALIVPTTCATTESDIDDLITEIKNGNIPHIKWEPNHV